MLTEREEQIAANKERQEELLAWMRRHPRLSLKAHEIRRRVAYLYEDRFERSIRTDLKVLESRGLVARDAKKRWSVMA